MVNIFIYKIFSILYQQNKHLFYDSFYNFHFPCVHSYHWNVNLTQLSLDILKIIVWTDSRSCIYGIKRNILIIYIKVLSKTYPSIDRFNKKYNFRTTLHTYLGRHYISTLNCLYSSINNVKNI